MSALSVTATSGQTRSKSSSLLTRVPGRSSRWRRRSNALGVSATSVEPFRRRYAAVSSVNGPKRYIGCGTGAAIVSDHTDTSALPHAGLTTWRRTTRYDSRHGGRICGATATGGGLASDGADALGRAGRGAATGFTRQHHGLWWRGDGIRPTSGHRCRHRAEAASGTREPRVRILAQPARSGRKWVWHRDIGRQHPGAAVVAAVALPVLRNPWRRLATLLRARLSRQHGFCTQHRRRRESHARWPLETSDGLPARFFSQELVASSLAHRFYVGIAAGF